MSVPIEPSGSPPASGHRGDDDLHLLVRVAEHLLAAQHAGVAVDDVLVVGQVGELDDALVEPLAVRLLRWPAGA